MNHPTIEKQLNSMHMHQDLEDLLIVDLRQLLDEPTTTPTHRAILTILTGLLLNLARQSALRKSMGYLSAVLKESPNWNCQVEPLHDRKMAILASLNSLCEGLSEELPLTVLADKLRGRLEGWMEAHEAQGQNESELLQKALTMEVGGES